MPPKKTAAELRDLVDTKKTAVLAGLNKYVQTDASLGAVISDWVTDVNSDLEDNLVNAAEAGRSFYIIESPVFYNPGKKSNGDTEHNGKSLYFEHVFREYLLSLHPPSFSVGTDVVVTPIVPFVPRDLTKEPVLPQNVVLRYKFSWA